MEWIGAGALAIVAGPLAVLVGWVSWTHGQRAGLWWAAAGLAIAVDGVIMLANSPAILVPFTRDAIGPTAAWLFYRGACDYSSREPHAAAAGLAAAATLTWLALFSVGARDIGFYASAMAEIPLVVMAAWMIHRNAQTTMTRFFSAACFLLIGLVIVNPSLKEAGISAPVVAEIWLAALTPVCIFAICVFLERSLSEKNRILEERSEQLRRYRQYLEATVEQRTAELEASQSLLLRNERLASIGTLTAGLAHQVNNPIGSIMAAAGFAKQCRGDDDEFETLRRAIEDIEREAARCGEIVHDMLRFASDRPSHKKEIPIDSVLDRVRDAVRRLERSREATLDFDLRGPSPRVCASGIELEQALTNVVENAIQSKTKGAHVRIERRQTGDAVRIAVADDGLGIPHEDLSHVLDPFFTSRLEAGGTGLGLSVAHGIAREHAGDLTIDSVEGHGTTVVLTIPTTD